MWILAKDLLGIAGLPETSQGISYRARKEGWQKQQAKGVKGRVLEYRIATLPVPVQTALMKKQGKVNVGGQEIILPKPKEKTSYCSEALWARWNKAGAKAQDKAKKTLKAVQAVQQLVNHQVPKMDAYQSVSDEFGIPVASLRRYCAQVKRIDIADWAPALLPKHKEAAQLARKKHFAEIDDQAWDFIKADYLSNEEPTLTVCYERLKDAASHNGWKIPSYDSIRRRMAFEVPVEQRVMLRKGEHALLMMYPPQERSVADLHAMQWINGDGYQHNVFVKWFNGEILRPKTWFWQDIYSRKIIGWRTDISENTDSIRLSMMDVFDKFGIPKEITIDNTRAAANKWMTGGVPNRYRFKVKEDDPLGIIPMMGIKLHWSSVILGKGHGQAKPIERAFGVGGLDEYIDKHPLNRGAYTGPNPMAKPDNYGSTAIDAEVFLQSVAKGVEMFNAKENRSSEACQGFMSYNQAFNASYESSAIRKATPEQLQLMMLQAEATRVSQHGTITLSAGGSLQGRKNRYHHETLTNFIGQKLVARFDPLALHESVEIYTLQGVRICTAACLDKVGFGDTQAAREHTRKRTQFGKANKIAAKAQHEMTALEAAALMKPLEEEVVPETKIVEPFRPVSIGSNAVKAQPKYEEDAEEEYEENFAASIAKWRSTKNSNSI
ncbi:transposase domain-containing protein [Aliivibrio sp. S4TY2]|uniref:transposase domain-containing protein n=1 Tax=unclassified Aliivibrio TaxID=2645654 RepID=UPI002378641D|nr:MULTISPECIES: transposase domain-containing protein [unclassified Aliivibrio]MDD9158424.1 transposase domain-containing protein [Aliivibrio sp. S4TY2]MDD9162424.1 transposase domain-containing protein [Aliivibrio sp. S4TY1]MDD9166417.1 transposase domain-containing protein [Aliivibrio sp. S4MY2]MDD9170415.1 transposase domain-containing protein [Aliivibrio sp. S4MY4]MDD9187496.1 transposase domain-containing protein [Aliivibrio sp. S4MY3]